MNMVKRHEAMEESPVLAGKKERTEGEVLGHTGTVVKFGLQTNNPREYLIVPRVGRKHSRAIRERLGRIVVDIEQLGAVIEMYMDKEEDYTLHAEQWSAIAGLVKQLVGPEFDELLDIVYDYSPDIAEDREWLEDNATDEEFFEALWVVMQMVLGPLANRLGFSITKEEETEVEDGEIPSDD